MAETDIFQADTSALPGGNVSNDSFLERFGFERYETAHANLTERPTFDELFEEEQRLANRPGLLRSAFAVENLAPAALRYLQRNFAGADDPDFVGVFNLTDEQQQKIFKGIPSRYWEYINQEANSLTQAVLIADQTRKVVEAEEIIMEAGWGGFAARLAAAMLDPVAIGVSLFTGGAAGVLAKTPKAMRLARLASGATRRRQVMTIGMFSGVENAAIEALIANDNPTRGIEDIIFAGMGGIVLGSGVGILGTRNIARLRPMAERVQRAMLAGDLDQIAKAEQWKISPEGELFQGGSKVERGKKVVDQMVKDLDLPDNIRLPLEEAAERGDLDMVYGNMVGRYKPDMFINPQVGMTAREAEHVAEIEVAADTEVLFVGAEAATAAAPTRAAPATVPTRAAAPVTPSPEGTVTLGEPVFRAEITSDPGGELIEIPVSGVDAAAASTKAQTAGAARLGVPEDQIKVISLREQRRLPAAREQGPPAETGRQLFHGTHESINEFTPREVSGVSTIDNFGTWFTASVNKAAEFGSRVFSARVKANRLLEAHTDNFKDFFFSNKSLFRSLFPNEPIETLERFKTKTPKNAREVWEMRAAYLRAFRQMLEDAGHDGVIWRNSNIDNRAGDAPHDVVVFFNKESIAAETAPIPPALPIAEGEPAIAVDYAGGGTMEAVLAWIRNLAGLNPMRIKSAAEREPKISAAYNKAHGTDFKPQDVHDVDPEQIRDAALYHASPVCKNLTKLNAKRKVLQEDIRAAEKIGSNITEARPKTVSVENVKEFADHPELMNPITKALDDAGYKWDVQIHDAADYGGAMTRKRMIIRGVLDGDLPPIPEKTNPADWFETIEGLIDDAPGDVMKGRKAGDPSDELRRIKRYADLPADDPRHLDLSKPIITMGASATRDVPAAAHAGGPAPSLAASGRAVPRLLIPNKGKTIQITKTGKVINGKIKRVTPRMMARLMGLPDSYPVPDELGLAKTILGNGIHGETTRNFIEPLMRSGSRAEPSAPRVAEGVPDAARAAAPDAPSPEGTVQLGQRVFRANVVNRKTGEVQNNIPVSADSEADAFAKAQATAASRMGTTPDQIDVTAMAERQIKGKSVLVTPVVPPAAPRAQVAILPAVLAGGKKSRYREFSLNFHSDIDLASYIAANPRKRSARDREYVQWVIDNTGWDEAQVRNHGAKVRERLKEISQGADTTTPLEIPPLDIESRLYDPADVTPRIDAGTEAVVESVDPNFNGKTVTIVGADDKFVWTRVDGVLQPMLHTDLRVGTKIMGKPTFKAGAVDAFMDDATRREVAAWNEDVRIKEDWEITREQYDRRRVEQRGLSFDVIDEGTAVEADAGGKSAWLGTDEKTGLAIRIVKVILRKSRAGTVTHELEHFEAGRRLTTALTDEDMTRLRTTLHEAAGLDTTPRNRTNAQRAVAADLDSIDHRRFELLTGTSDEIVRAALRAWSVGDESTKALIRDASETVANLAESIDFSDLVPHREVVRQAISAGRSVPDEVLVEYPDLVRAAGKTLDDVKQRIAERVAQQAGPEGQEARKGIIASVKERLESLIPRRGIPPSKRPPAQRGDLSLGGKSDSGGGRRKIGLAQFSMAGVLAQSAAPSMRSLISILANNAVQTGRLMADTASEWVTRTVAAERAQFWGVARPEFNKWVRRNQSKKRYRFKDYDQFFEEVGKAVRREEYNEIPEVAVVADYMRKRFDEIGRKANRHGVRGFEITDFVSTYLPRMVMPSVTEALINKHGIATVNKLWGEAFWRANNKGPNALTYDQSLRLGKAYVAIMRDTGRYNDMQRASVFNGAALEHLRSQLQNLTQDADGTTVRVMTDAEIEFTIRGLAPAESEAPITAFGRARSVIDENHFIDLPDGTQLHLNAFMENNAANLFEMYNAQVHGAIGVSKVLEEMSRVTRKQFDTIEQLNAHLREDMRSVKDAKGGRAIDDNKIDRDLRRVAVIFRSIMGQRLHPDQHSNEMLFGLRLYNNMRLSGQFGIAQLPEFGTLVGSVGWGAVMRQMPALMGVLNKAADAEAAPQLMREMALIGAYGMSIRNSEILPRMDIGGALNEFSANTLIRRMRVGAKWASMGSVMLPIHVTQKKWSALLVAQKIADFGFTGNIVDGKRVGGRSLGKNRMNQLGLSPEAAENVLYAINRHGTREQGAFGGERLMSFNFEKWNSPKDAQAASDLIAAVSRWSDRAIQENDIGNMSLFMTRDMGRILFQFRNFVLVGWEKQFLSRIAMVADTAHGDREMAWRVASEVWHASIIAGMAYAVQQTVNAQGLDERAKKKLLSERLSMKNMAAVTFRRAGWSAITPDLMEVLYRGAGFDGTIFGGRGTGLAPTSISMEGLWSNPTTNLLNDIGTTIHNVQRAVRERGQILQTDTELRKAWGLLFFNRLPIVYNMGNLVREGFDLPERRSTR